MFKAARPLSRKDILKLVKKFKEIFGLENEYMFPIVEFIEWVMPQIDRDFDLEIVDESEMSFNTYALTFPDEKKMVIRRDVYDGACEEQVRSRFTVAHELGHYLFHRDLGFARTDEKPPTYMNPEWQANEFAAELLAPQHLIKDMSVEDIMEKCKVSKQCAEIQLNKAKRHR